MVEAIKIQNSSVLLTMVQECTYALKSAKPAAASNGQEPRLRRAKPLRGSYTTLRFFG